MNGPTPENDNLAALPCQSHPDFPSGDDLTLLMDIRNAMRELVVARGLPETGCGVGIEGADASFRLGRRQLIVTISIYDPDKEPT